MHFSIFSLCKKINLPKYQFSGLINYVLRTMLIWGYWEYIVLEPNIIYHRWLIFFTKALFFHIFPHTDLLPNKIFHKLWLAALDFLGTRLDVLKRYIKPKIESFDFFTFLSKKGQNFAKLIKLFNSLFPDHCLPTGRKWWIFLPHLIQDMKVNKEIKVLIEYSDFILWFNIYE